MGMVIGNKFGFYPSKVKVGPRRYEEHASPVNLQSIVSVVDFRLIWSEDVILGHSWDSVPCINAIQPIRL